MIDTSIKIICTILFFPLMAFGGAKGNYFFPEIRFREIELKEINKDSTLKIIRGFKEYKRIFGITDIYDTVNHFYLSDVDNDKKKELIYYGLISAEGKWSIIWKIEHQDYRLFGELYGKIIGISDSAYISTLGTGCCESNCDYANFYSIMQDAIEFQRSVAMYHRIKNPHSLFLRSEEHADRVTIPDSPPIRKKIEIKNTHYNLRAQPVINDSLDSTTSMEQFGELRGNRILVLSKGTIAVVTAAHTDRTGNVWWFLVLDNPPDVQYNVYNECKQTKRQICGWVITKDLDYIEIR